MHLYSAIKEKDSEAAMRTWRRLVKVRQTFATATEKAWSPIERYMTIAGRPLSKTARLKRVAVRWLRDCAAGGANYHTTWLPIAVDAGALQRLRMAIQGTSSDQCNCRSRQTTGFRSLTRVRLGSPERYGGDSTSRNSSRFGRDVEE